MSRWHRDVALLKPCDGAPASSFESARSGRVNLRVSRSAGRGLFEHRTAGPRTTLDQPGPRPAGRPPDQTIRLGPETGWRGGGPPCPPAGHSRNLLSTFSTPLSRPPAAGPRCPLRWASNQRPPLEWTQQQRRGSADLCVRPLGIHRKTPVPMGREQIWIGPDPQSSSRKKTAPPCSARHFPNAGRNRRDRRSRRPPAPPASSPPP